MKRKQNHFFFNVSMGRNAQLKMLWISIVMLVPLNLALAYEHTDLSHEANVEALYQNNQPTSKQISGVVYDDMNATVPGVTIYIKGSTTGTTSDIDGKYNITVRGDDDILVFSFIGLLTQEVPVNGKNQIDITLLSDVELLDDVVIVGYGSQKKESIVGAITQAKGEDLQKAGGVTNVGEALQGRLPGVTTIASSGLPGDSDPLIYIRGQSSWNGGGQPLILVDGVERSMSDIDMNEIDKISVLKDASATAVLGVKGANGVILITTKRGKVGKAKLSLSANSTMKMYSKLPEKTDSYNSVLLSNESIMRELMYEPSVWDSYVPMQIADKYQNPTTEEEKYIYPNVDWADAVLKDYAMDYRVNMSVRGGSDFAKYFGSLSYQSVSDLFKGESYDNGKGYKSSYRYDRFNYRSNLDFEITKTTEFSVNLSGYYGIQEKPDVDLGALMNSIYLLSPAIYTPVYPDGYYGYYNDIYVFRNPIAMVTNSGSKTNSRFQINSDFTIKQKLDFITKGLSFKAMFSYDNNMTSKQTLSDNAISNSDNIIYRIYDIDGTETIRSPLGVNNFDFVYQPWGVNANRVDDGSRSRRLNYEFALNYNRTFDDKHNVTALALMKREEYAYGSMFPRYREDWVGRLTYNYDTRYFLDMSGAYNGSEQFGEGFRFDLFPSLAAGWMVSNEGFMANVDWVDRWKVKGSYGLVGDDNIGGNNDRWKYMSQWVSRGTSFLTPSNFNGRSPYTWYSEFVVGNPNLQWETSLKSNIGTEISVLNSLFTVDFDYFQEDRDNILIRGEDRSVPDFYGFEPAYANTGQVYVKGYELVLGSNYTFDNGLNLWAEYNITKAVDEVILKEEPLYRPSYQKEEGYPIGQPKVAIPGDIITNWDDIYMATPLNTNQSKRRPGFYDLMDFNGDGNYDSTYDNAPFGYPERPQKTWSFVLGARYRGFSLMAHLYGTQNATRYYNSYDFDRQMPVFYQHQLGYWSVDNPSGTKSLAPWSLNQAATDPYSNYYDASLVRLKTIELSYDFSKQACSRIGVDGLRLFANGNNLYLWTDMPDDREHNGGSNYPTMKRFNFGLNVNF